MTVAPFRRPAMVDIPWGERERWWTRTTRRLAERRRWGEVDSLAELGELVAQFCEGRLLETPGHCGPREPETVGIAAPLAHANRNGFLTTGSQPGEDDDGLQQRAFVDGWATPATVKRLEGLVRGTRLMMRTTAKLPRRTDCSDIVDVTRHVYPNGDARVFTDFGAVPSRNSPGLDFDRADLVGGAAFVQIYDPEWGPQTLLWDRLGQHDWDDPAPPTPSIEEVAMPRHDRYGDRGPKRDQSALDATYAIRIGETTRIHRLDGSEVDYRYTVAGWRMVAGTDTKANAKAEVERDLAAQAVAEKAEPDARTTEIDAADDETERRHQARAAGSWTPAPQTLTDAELNVAARDWVADCTWKDIEDPEDLEDLTDEEIRRGVDRHYEGGWQQFVQDTNGYDPPAEKKAAVNAAYEAEAQRQADHRRRHNEWLDAENEKSAAHRREQDEETARRARLAADLARHDAAVEARKRTDLADLRRGRWYDEKPITSTNTGSGGSGMSSIDEVRAGINASNEKANEGLGAVQQAHAALEEAQGLLMHATEGSGQADVSDSLGMLAQSIAAIEEARQMLPAAISASEGVANRL